MAALQKGIDLTVLPRTFRDAIKLCRELGYRHLWIDSLCIIQDSLADWSSESHTMNLVYSHAAFTIAAAHARDSEGGLFVRRKVASVVPPVVWSCWPKRSGRRYCLVPDNFLEELESAPLCQRAWAVQERVLSPRILFFARSQVFYQCCHLTACESFPEGLPHYQAKQSFRKLGHATASAEDVWNSVAKTYTKSALTHDSDKIVAIAGVAEQMKELLGQEYIVGLWRHDLPIELLWQCLEPETAGRHLPRMAPTWSWLSITGTISRHPRWERVYRQYFELCELHIDLVDQRHTTGNVRSAWLKLSGILKPISRGVYKGHKYIRMRWRRVYSHTFNWDVRPDAELLARTLVLFPVVAVTVVIGHSTYESLKGLMLVLKDQATNTYERVGTFSSIEKDARMFFYRKAQAPCTTAAQGAWERYRNQTEHVGRRIRDVAWAVAGHHGGWEPIPEQEFTLV